MFQTMTYQIPQWLANEIENLTSKYNLIHGSLLQLTNYVIHLEKKVVALENEKNKNSSKLNTKCKFSDKGFCKKRQDCLYQHPQLICQKFLETDKCDHSKTCPFRHPKKCKFGYKCFRRRSHCQYLHSDDEERQETETNDEKLNKVDNEIDIDKTDSNHKADSLEISNSEVEIIEDSKKDDDTLEYGDESDDETI